MRLKSTIILSIIGFSVSCLYLSPESALAAKQKIKAQAAQKDRGSQAKEIAPLGCKASILMDAATGDILAEKDADMSLPPASMVKMMVAYVTKKKIKDGIINPTDIVRTSAKASKMGGSQVYLKAGEEFTLEQLLDAIMIQSANDAATAVAEYVGGSVEGFVMMMNEEAISLGMKNTVFQTPHGLPPSAGEKDDLTTPRDMAILGRALITEFPELIQLTRKLDGDFRNGQFKLHNHNNLLRLYDGCDGIKTGFHNGAGFCITATALRNNVRMIASVMGCSNIKTRTEEASRLMSQGFAQYRMVKLIDEGAVLGQMVPVSGGKKKEVMPIAAKKVTGVVRIADANKVVQQRELCSDLKAPVAKDTPCGQVRFMINDREVGRVNAVIGEDIPKATWTEWFFNLF